MRATENSLEIVRVRADEAKRALAAYSAEANERLAYLYGTYAELRAKHWPDQQLPDAVLAIGEMNDKKLAHYKRENAYKVPNEIEFNRNFIALNWDNRELIDFTLLHEMIHLYQDAVLGEQHKDQQAAHGRSFRQEANRVGVAGKGRLMACPYPVKMPEHYTRPSRRTGAHPHDQGEKTPARPTPAGSRPALARIRRRNLAGRAGPPARRPLPRHHPGARYATTRKRKSRTPHNISTKLCTSRETKQRTAWSALSPTQQRRLTRLCRHTEARCAPIGGCTTRIAVGQRPCPTQQAAT